MGDQHLERLGRESVSKNAPPSPIFDLSLLGILLCSQSLAGEWMAGAHSESVGLFHADGHVRVYHGSLTDLPRRYIVARV